MSVNTLEILQRALPLGLANMSVVLMPLLDSVMLGRHGIESLAAGGLAMQIYIGVFIIGEGLVLGFGTLYGQHREQQNPDEIRELAYALYLLLGLLGLIAMVIGTFGSSFFSALGQSKKLADSLQPYLILLSLATLPSFLFIHFWELLSYERKGKKIIEGACLQLISNAAINYILIFGNLGAPELGLLGAGIGTLLGALVGAGWLYIAVRAKASCEKHDLNIANIMEQARKIVKIGLPIGLSILSTVAYLSLSVIFMGWFSHAALAAHIAVLQLNEVLIVFILGFAEYSTIHTADNYTKETNASFKAFSTKVSIIALGLMSLVLILTYIGRNLIYDLFSFGANNDARILMDDFFSFSIYFLILDGLVLIILGLLRGRAETLAPLIISTSAIWSVGMLSQVGLMTVYPHNPITVWIGMQIGFAAAAAGLFLYMTWYIRFHPTLNK